MWLSVNGRTTRRIRTITPIEIPFTHAVGRRAWYESRPSHYPFFHGEFGVGSASVTWTNLRPGAARPVIYLPESIGMLAYRIAFSRNAKTSSDVIGRSFKPIDETISASHDCAAD